MLGGLFTLVGLQPPSHIQLLGRIMPWPSNPIRFDGGAVKFGNADDPQVRTGDGVVGTCYSALRGQLRAGE